jgi:hypothetical protein
MTPDDKLKALEHHLKIKELVKQVVEEMKTIRALLKLKGLDYTFELSLLVDKIRGGVAYTGLVEEEGTLKSVDINFEGAEEYKPVNEAAARTRIVEEMLKKLGAK